MTITEFLLVRIAEDEERARFVQQQNASQPWPEGADPWALSWHDEYDLLCVEPSRALAECEAKRRILAEWQRAETENRRAYGVNPAPSIIARALAQPYAAHPDYQPEWAA